MTYGAPHQPTPPACVNHPGAAGFVRCQRCGNPLCGNCMIEAPVGFQCPACVRSASAAVRSGRPAWRRFNSASIASVIMVGLNVAVWLAISLTGGANSVVATVLGLNMMSTCDLPEGTYLNVEAFTCASRGGLFLPGIAQFAFWKLLTTGFTHVAVPHLLFNMLVLWLLGPQLDRFFGTIRFLGLYLGSILVASAFVLVLSPPQSFVVGASGGLFGLMGALLVVTLLRRWDVRQILVWLGINVVFTFAIPGISWQGHLGGFVGGCLIAYVLLRLSQQRAGAATGRMAP